ncbi:MAG: slipin family protein [Acidimicrobiales bacterium]
MSIGLVLAALGGGAVAGIVIAIIIILCLFVLPSVFRVVTEYERAVFFRFGRVRPSAKGPGVVTRIPIVDRVVKVNLRVEVVDIPPQAVITADNVTVSVDAVVYFQVIEPIKAIIGVDNFRVASQRLAMTSLRSIIGRHQLDDVLAHRDKVNTELRATIAASTQSWGVEVRQVEIRDVSLPQELQRAMARQAEAERERRAKVIAATGELEASRELAEAADRLTQSPGALQLRTLQTLAEVATERNSTMVFPIPIELLTAFQDMGRAVGAGRADAATHRPGRVTVPDPPAGDQGRATDNELDQGPANGSDRAAAALLPTRGEEPGRPVDG